MVDAPLDAGEIFRVLQRQGVDYVVVGGLAVQTHGHVRMTNDVDLIPAPAPANLEALAAALNELEARVLNPGSESVAIDAAMLPRATLWQFATRHGDIDVLHDAPGAGSFAALRSRALVLPVAGAEVPVVSLDDLIRMKRASGRPVDLEDIAALTAFEGNE
jgi:hypothetical protein